MKTLLLFLLSAAVIPADLAAQPEKTRTTTPPVKPLAASPPALSKMAVTGQVSVGAPAPPFDISDANDRRMKLSDYRGDRVVLAFADESKTLSDFGATAATLRTEGVRLVGICRESPHRLHTVAERDSLGFDLLSDSTGEIAAIYGMYDFRTSSVTPAYVLVDRRGTVRMVVQGPLTPDQVLQVTRYDLPGWERSP